MSYNNKWLFEQLGKLENIQLESNYSPLIRAHHRRVDYLIYAPTSGEYIISVDLVEKVMKLGGNTISYPSSWCRASNEALAFAKERNFDILAHGVLLAKLGK